MDPIVKQIYAMNNSKWRVLSKFRHLWLRIVYSCDIMPGLVIGRHCRFAHRGLGVIINSEAKIGDNVKIGGNVCIGGRSGQKPPTIEDNVQIGIGAIVLGDITISKYTQIGAGAVVVKSTPPYSVVVGNPAKVIKVLTSQNNNQK